MTQKSTASYTLIGGEESYRNKLNQSPMAMRRLENFIPSMRGDLEQKDASFTFSPGQTPSVMFQYKRVENNGAITRLLLYAANVAGIGWKVFVINGIGTTGTELFPGTSLYAPLAAEPVFVQPNNNLCYFTDGERWYGTDGTSVQLAGIDFPVDPPTFTLGGTGTGVLNVTVNRFYWVAWADMGSTASPEITQWSSSGPISAGTGILTNDKVTITRPGAPPRRATHWLLFASETDGDAVFGALLAVIPIATTTFVDQSPFTDQSGTAMVTIRRPIRNQPMVPGSHALLYKGRIFVCGFNRVPVVIRNPSFDTPAGSTLDGWTQTGSPLAVPTSFDGPGACQLAGSSSVSQDVHLIFKPGRYYRIEAAASTLPFGGGSLTVALTSVISGTIATSTVVLANNTPYARTAISLTALLSNIPSDLQLTFSSSTGGAVAIDVDFIRIWELIPPSNVAFSALEEVEGLLNGRGEESFPGSTSTPQNADASDIVNVLSYPQEASQLIGMAQHLDNLVVFSDVSGAFLLGTSFDDFGFTDLAFGMGMASRFAATNSRVGLFFVSYDLKVMHLPPPTSTFQASILPEEVSLPIRDQLGGPTARIDNTQPVWLRPFDYASRAWLLLTYATVGGTGRVFRLYDLETKMWFRFTELTSPQPVVVYEASAGKKVLLCADQSNGSVQVVSDIMGAYPATTNTVPTATFRQALFDLDDPGMFKDWKDVSIHSSVPVSGRFWIDPVDPQNPGNGTQMPLNPLEQLPEISRAFLSQTSNSYGKRILTEFVMGSGAPAGGFGRVYGIEVTAEPRTRYAR
jgi:hypothetical protein